MTAQLVGNQIVAINPSSDIVLGVALAADPDKYRAAVEKLQRLHAIAQADLDASQWQASTTRDAPAANADARLPGSASAGPMGSPPRRERSPDAFGQLEAFVMQSFIKSMLPKSATHVFGKGTAGEVWKSMLAEKLGGEVARSGQVGLAERLRAGTPAARLDAAAAGAVPPSPALASVLRYLQPDAAASSTAPTTSSKGAKS